MKIIFLAIILTSSVLSNQFTSVYGVGLANLNIQIPNLSYKVDNVTLRLYNGFTVAPAGSIRQASLDDRILNADLNDDGNPDAIVILTVVYDGVGYFTKVAFAVLQDYATGAITTNGIQIGIAIYKLDIFSMDSDNKDVLVGFMDRLPGQPKAALPTVPTIKTLYLENKVFKVRSTKTIDASCYPFY